MTDSRSATGAPPSRTVRRSLRALTDGTAPSRTPIRSTDAPSYRRIDEVVSDAETATSCARTAARFLRDGRIAELEAAIAAADRRGAREATRRGQEARETLRGLSAALDGEANAPVATTSAPVAERF
ncbi:hypothetical protein [Halobellus captivus]|uniref:hypothetical protein n=1 Tax=Halobellus captivus TaxID=2592614 RepID=UPI00119E0B12|nr:hypothetical protein [Halobellus captivus]